MSELETLDARRLLCPLPVIRTQDRIRDLAPGSVLEVTATDPGTMHDIPAWCRVHGHEMLDAQAFEGAAGEESGYIFRIRVAEQS